VTNDTDKRDLNSSFYREIYFSSRVECSDAIMVEEKLNFSTLAYSRCFL